MHETFKYILGAISDDISKVTTKFKEPTSPECQLGLTVYCLAYGCSYSTVGDLFGVALSTACTIFSSVINVIVQSMYDGLVMLPQGDEEWRKELTSFIEDWEFPCVEAWDGFHVYISCHLKNFFSFKKHYLVTNMGLIASNKRFFVQALECQGHCMTQYSCSPQIYSMPLKLVTAYLIKFWNYLDMDKYVLQQQVMLHFLHVHG